MARPNHSHEVAAPVGYVFSPSVTVAVDIVAWGVLHAVTGYAVHRMRLTRFGADWWIHRPRRFERDGRFYVRVLRIRRWKHRLPEAGSLFAGGFDKKALRSAETSYLDRYVHETRRAELGHWLCLLCSPLFVLWNPWPVAAAMVAYGVASNGPCIAATRFNRIRLRRVLAAATRQAG